MHTFKAIDAKFIAPVDIFHWRSVFTVSHPHQHICPCPDINPHQQTHIYANTHTYICFTCMYIHIYVYAHVCIHTLTYIRVY